MISQSWKKISFIVLLLAATWGYALYQKSIFWPENGDVLILQNLPLFSLQTLSGEKVQSTDLLSKSTKGLVVHFWGTWCGPCEAEFPALLDLAKRFESSGLHFLLIAVNDEKMKVNKFLKRFDLPKNTTIAIDNDRVSMSLMGTVKVPETYLFSATGIHLKKYVGPQDWEHSSYFDQISRLIGPH